MLSDCVSRKKRVKLSEGSRRPKIAKNKINAPTDITTCFFPNLSRKVSKIFVRGILRTRFALKR